MGTSRRTAPPMASTRKASRPTCCTSRPRSTRGIPRMRAGVSYVRWVRYLLDTCATVEDTVEAMRHVRVADVLASHRPGSEGKSFGVHLAVEDASGDSAIYEVINGT